MTLIRTQSDVYYQIKPSKLQELKMLLEASKGSSLYDFGNRNFGNRFMVPQEPHTIWSTYTIRFTNAQIYKLLKKSIGIIENTEEYAEYLLNSVFVEEKSKNYSLPPGTLRLYSQELVCFYNGKTWRKISL